MEGTAVYGTDQKKIGHKTGAISRGECVFAQSKNFIAEIIGGQHGSGRRAIVSKNVPAETAAQTHLLQPILQSQQPGHGLTIQNKTHEATVST
jgi:hypothetical protein